ncbi:Ornithine carbamoyltransferase [Flexistipes sinusarabici DSM 4947]|uniref:Ornithine carbamoyltransferase n=1 Tax=Flexistipes sinusarabici (strain ATCC 49648 / DSM 4947 / MAS 10) TaxID=717231 RepID=F8E558_FLESM|nr:ornithine carbamoyltransferase [Flexistipes sinusarabici]AEI15694.1 Ornithine carbamoyltransferase [Flexistipes sinusarabici DSM 4947]
MKDFLTLKDFSSEELFDFIKLADEMKNGVYTKKPLADKKIALIFEKSSTRTRVSFEVGVYELGGYPLFLSKDDIQLGRGESIKDTARTLSRYVDGIMIRTFAHSKLEELAENASIPVINGLTDDLHPCQVMADVLTIYEKLGKLKGVKVAFVGDGNNMAHSWVIGAAKFGMDIVVASPRGYECDEKYINDAVKIAEGSGSNIFQTNDPFTAVKGADVIYTDVWASMGQESEAGSRKEKFADFQVNGKLMQSTGKNTIFMHCLPAHLGEEVTEDVFESGASVVFDEAENRLHAQKAIMAKLIGKS